MLIDASVLGTPPLVLPITGVAAYNSAIQVRDVAGLEPVDTSIVTTPDVSSRGGVGVGTSTGNRNIVFKLGLNPNWATQSISELRRLLYKYLMPGLEVQLQFNDTDFPLCGISGYVESFSPNLFAKDPEVVVSIICPQPDFVAVSPMVLEGLVPENDPSPITIAYAGTVSTGLLVEILPGPDSEPPTEDVLDWLELRFSYPVSPGFEFFAVLGVKVDYTQSFRMISIPGKRRVEHVTDAFGFESTENLLQKIAVADELIPWPTLYPGDNGFGILRASPLPGQNWRLTYYERHGGF